MSNFDNFIIVAPESLTGSRFVELLGLKFNLYGLGQGKIELTEKLLSQNLLKGYQAVDITNPENTYQVLNSISGKYLINFAGATLVDEIEKTRPPDPENLLELNANLAYKVNVIGTKNLIEACKKTNKFPIFISTGFVFDGKSGPYSEDAAVASNPSDISWYAWTKVLAEKEVINSGMDYLMIRISYPYRKDYPGKSDFARNFIKLYDDFKNGTRDGIYPVFTDQALTPTFIDDISEAVPILIQNQATGIYHLTSPETTTPYEFCCEVLKVARGIINSEKIVPKGRLAEFQKSHPEIAKRPLYGGEKSDKIKQLGFTPTSWREGIKKAFG